VELTRREFLLGGVAPFVVAPPTAPPISGSAAEWAVPYGVPIAPRTSWVPETAPIVTGLAVEPAIAVLVVHHSETRNDYLVDDVPTMLRSFRAYHVSKKKGWPDVAYNFFVDRFGGVWEGRTGSLTAPVIGSATGGNQGSSQLVCLAGNHTTVPPTEAALASLVHLLAALADHYALPLGAETTTEFVSRGSSRWPAEAIVRTRTIEGHRAMSMTSCPGEAAHRLLPAIRSGVDALRVARQPVT
jgi:hypothetical protein